MNKDEDVLLDACFAAARCDMPAPPAGLAVAVLADAAAVTAERNAVAPPAAPARVPAVGHTASQRAGWRRVLRRGWAPAGALAASALLGLWLGIESDTAQTSLLAETAFTDIEDPVAGFFDLASAEN